MGRESRASDAARWQQLAAAVLELAKNQKVLEQRLKALEQQTEPAVVETGAGEYTVVREICVDRIPHVES